MKENRSNPRFNRCLMLLGGQPDPQNSNVSFRLARLSIGTAILFLCFNQVTLLGRTFSSSTRSPDSKDISMAPAISSFEQAQETSPNDLKSVAVDTAPKISVVDTTPKTSVEDSPEENNSSPDSPIVERLAIDPLYFRQLAKSPRNASSRFHIPTGEDCECDFISVDCLDSMRCMAHTDEATERQLIVLGVATRGVFKQHREIVKFRYDIQNYPNAPWGKSLQYITAESWDTWLAEGRMAKHIDKQEPSFFTNESWYPDCVKHDLKGKGCFIGEWQGKEDLGELEKKALKSPEGLEIVSNDTVRELLRRDWVEYKFKARKGYDPDALPALGHLLAFSHIARVIFHRRKPIRDIYNKRLKSKMHVSQDKPRLRISLHIRRADACFHETKGHAKVASPLDSPGQPSNEKRICYATSVYMDAIKRVAELAGKPLDVYLGTDDAGSLLTEIKRKYKDLYYANNWHIMSYSRDTFKYEDVIENPDGDRTKQAMLGESAVSDLFHLSHGQVFVGHLGSRFGKIAYLLATARHNTFVPFFSVDGHSYCCEVDEPCGEMKQYIPHMRDCLTFIHEFTVFEQDAMEYWEIGSMKRKMAREREKKGLPVM